jgi:hypothetical protein
MSNVVVLDHITFVKTPFPSAIAAEMQVQAPGRYEILGSSQTAPRAAGRKFSAPLDSRWRKVRPAPPPAALPTLAEFVPHADRGDEEEAR